MGQILEDLYTAQQMAGGSLQGGGAQRDWKLSLVFGLDAHLAVAEPGARGDAAAQRADRVAQVGTEDLGALKPENLGFPVARDRFRCPVERCDPPVGIDSKDALVDYVQHQREITHV